MQTSDPNKAMLHILKSTYGDQLKYAKSKTTTSHRGRLSSAPSSSHTCTKPGTSTVELSMRQKDPRSRQPTASILRAEVIQPSGKPRRVTVDCSMAVVSSSIPSDPRLVSQRVADVSTSASSATERFRISPAPIAEPRRNTSTSSDSSITSFKSINVPYTRRRNLSSSSESSSTLQDPRQGTLPLDHLNAPCQVAQPIINHSESSPGHLTATLSSSHTSSVDRSPNTMKSNVFKGESSRVARTSHYNVNTKQVLDRVTQGLAKESQSHKRKPGRRSGSSGSSVGNIRERLSKSKKLT